MSTTEDRAGEVYVSGAGEPVAVRTPPGQPGRSSQEIRANIERTREELGRSVELLRGRVADLTDWRRQVREHRNELIAGAAVAGFLIGGIVALRRRR